MEDALRTLVILLVALGSIALGVAALKGLVLIFQGVFGWKGAEERRLSQIQAGSLLILATTTIAGWIYYLTQLV